MSKLNDARISIAVIGAGWVASHRHLPVIASDPRFKLVGVLDRHEPRAVNIARDYGLHRWASGTRLSDVPWIDEVQAVSIATPPDSHAALLMEARAAGIHALTEKPFTVKLSDAEDAAAASSGVVAVMHNFQFARSAQRLWSDIASGGLGQIRAAEARQWSSRDRRLPEWYESLPLGLFFDESPHLLYLLRHLAPEIRLEDAHVAQLNDGRTTPSIVRALYSSGGQEPYQIELSLNFEAGISEWYLAVHGSKAVGIVDLFRDIYIRIPHDRKHQTPDVLRTSIAATLHHWTGFASSGVLHLRGHLRYGVDEVFGRFGDAIAARSDPRECGRADALAVRRMQDEIIKYARVSSPSDRGRDMTS